MLNGRTAQDAPTGDDSRPMLSRTPAQDAHGSRPRVAVIVSRIRVEEKLLLQALEMTGAHVEVSLFESPEDAP